VLQPGKDRRLIPRWRSSRVTICTGELDSTVVGRRGVLAGSAFFEEKLRDWQQNPTVEYAAEVVAAAVVEGQHEHGKEAAKFLLSGRHETTPTIMLLANKLLDKNSNLTASSCSEETVLKSIDERPEDVIKRTRAKLNSFPRDALLWVDLSRAYAVLGQWKQAIRAMEIGLRLQPTNRFVVRSASRLFVHIDDPEYALRILRRSETVKYDPWLLAAEISVGSIVGRSSRFIRTAYKLLDSLAKAPQHITELAGALATVELYEGAVKNAKKLFDKSLQKPTDNTLAQAWWALRQVPKLDIKTDFLRIPFSFEARALHDFQIENWKKVIKHCEDWLIDEPFSSRPAELGSYVAAEAIEDYRLCEKLARRGLEANPSHQMLLNNLVYALANQKKLDDAEKIFRKIPRPADNTATECTLLATEGLLRFRRGNIEAGRLLYMNAMKLAKQDNLQVVRAAAAVHLAREEIIAHTSEVNKAVDSAQNECKLITDSEITRLLHVVQKLNKKK